MADSAEIAAQARGQGGEFPVERPERCVRRHEDGGEQCHVDGAAARIMEFLPLDKGKNLVGCRDDCLLQFPKIADRTLTWRRWCAACEFKHDERVTQNLVRRKQ